MEPKQIPTPSDILLGNLKPVEQPSIPEAPSNAPAPVEPQTPATPEAATTEIKFDDWDEPTEPAKTPEVKTEPAKPEPKAEAPKSPETPAVDEWQGVDERLKKAVEFAKRGGDFMTYLGIHKVDYSKIDPVELYKSSVLNNNSFTPDEAKELLESLSPLQMKERGIQLQAEYTRWQNSQVSEFEQSLKAAEAMRASAKAKADGELKSTLDKVDKIAGLSLKPHHKQDIYDAITSGRMQQELFYNQKTGDYDYQSMIETYFVKKNLPKILDHVKKITSSDTLRAHVKETSNVNIDKSREMPEPQATPSSDPLTDFINRSRSGKR